MVRGAFTGTGKWLFGILAGALAAVIGAYASGLLDAFLPSPQELACRIGVLGSEPAPGTHFTVLVSDLAGDTDDKQTCLIADTLDGQRGLHVVRTCRVLRLPERGLITGAAEEQGRWWLRQWNADLLVWGEVAKADDVLRLRFLGREGEGEVGSYRLNEELELPSNFDEAFALQLEAVALASVAPVTEQQGTYLVSVLRPVAEKLKRLVAERFRCIG